MLVQGFLLAALLAFPSHGLFAQVLSRASVYKIGVSRNDGHAGRRLRSADRSR